MTSWFSNWLAKTLGTFLKAGSRKVVGSAILDPGQPAGWQVVGPVIGCRISKTLPETADQKKRFPETADPKRPFPDTANSKNAVSRNR